MTKSPTEVVSSTRKIDQVIYLQYNCHRKLTHNDYVHKTILFTYKTDQVDLVTFGCQQVASVCFVPVLLVS